MRLTKTSLECIWINVQFLDKFLCESVVYVITTHCDMHLSSVNDISVLVHYHMM